MGKIGFEHCLELLQERKDLLESNRIYIADFLKHISAEVGHRRTMVYYFKLAKIAFLLNKDFKETTEDDIRDLIRKIDFGDVCEKGNRMCKYEAHTKTTIKVIIKRFYRWLEGNNKIVPDKVSWIKCKEKDYKTRKCDDLLTESEIIRIIDACDRLRDKAILSLLYESAARPHEILALKCKHIVFTSYGCLLTIPNETKTGLRKIPIVKSYNTVKEYLASHPDFKNGDSPLWLMQSKGGRAQFSYAAFFKQLSEAVKKTGLDKGMKITPYLFRHTRLTELAKVLTEAQLKQYAGWTQDSKVASVYVHLSARDLEDAVLKVNGINEGKEDAIIECVRCNKKYPIGTELCGCGMPLSVRAFMQNQEDLEKQEEERRKWDNVNDTFLEILMKNPAISQAIEEAKQELISRGLAKEKDSEKR